MYGVAIGHINEQYLLTDYLEFIVPSMRMIQHNSFNKAIRLNISTNSSKSEKYGL